MNVTVFAVDLDDMMMSLTTGQFLGICMLYVSENMKRNKNNVLQNAARYFFIADQ